MNKKHKMILALNFQETFQDITCFLLFLTWMKDSERVCKL